MRSPAAPATLTYPYSVLRFRRFGLRRWALMPQITIDGKTRGFSPGQMIIQVANAHGIAIPQYCYHDALSIVASCRICLAEVWQPNPRNNNALEPIPKLVPTCQTACAEVVPVLEMIAAI